MKKRIILLTTIIVLSGILVYILFFIFSFRDQKEYKLIVNPINNERIYLIKTSWGFGDSKMAIGIDRKLKGGFNYHYPEKYESENSGDSPILYKLTNDTLYVYDGDFIKPKTNKFKTMIVLLELTPVERIEIYRNYKIMGLNIFPENQTYIIENLAK